MTLFFGTGEECDIFRGIWFYDGYEPFEYGEEVEREHLKICKDDAKKDENNEDNGKSGNNILLFSLSNYTFMVLILFYSFERCNFWRHACSVVFN